ncbi:MAG: EutN/CcmL family microcompartment protein, partial [Elusimicrobia bacterium]|nr:EutN/CcmL family microcompartment protein [Elusimicrobiota bacterium]
MFIGEVVGNVWGTRKHPSLKDRRLLLVRPIDPLTGQRVGDAVMALDGGVQS